VAPPVRLGGPGVSGHPAVWLDALRFELGAALLRLGVAVVRAVAR